MADQLDVRGWRLGDGSSVEPWDAKELFRDTVTALFGPADSYFSAEHPTWVSALAADMVRRSG